MFCPCDSTVMIEKTDSDIELFFQSPVEPDFGDLPIALDRLFVDAEQRGDFLMVHAGEVSQFDDAGVEVVLLFELGECLVDA